MRLDVPESSKSQRDYQKRRSQRFPNPREDKHRKETKCEPHRQGPKEDAKWNRIHDKCNQNSEFHHQCNRIHKARSPPVMHNPRCIESAKVGKNEKVVSPHTFLPHLAVEFRDAS